MPTPRAPKATPMPDVPQRVALYLRVSSEDQAERDTIEAQRYFFGHYVAAHALDVTERYEDNGVSGTLPLHQRPEGRRLLDDAAIGRFATVVVFKVDRLGRSLAVLMEGVDLHPSWARMRRVSRKLFRTLGELRDT